MNLPTVTLQASFTGAPFSAPTWTDITYAFRGATITRGRQLGAGLADIFSGFQMGSMTLTLSNANGDFDPTNPLSPYYPNVLPMTPVQLVATWNTTTYPVFSGYVYAWPPTYLLPHEEFVTVTVNDAFTILQSASVAAEDGIPGEMTDNRISRVLADVVPTLPTTIEAGLSHMAPIPAPGTTLGPPVIATALAMCQDAERTEYGAFYVDQAGIINFENRYHRSQPTLDVSFADDGTGIAYSDLQPSFDMSVVYNDVQVTDSLASPRFYRYQDDVSQSAYGVQTLVINSQCDTPNEGYDQAAWIVQSQSQPQLRFGQIQFSGQQDATMLDATWDAALGSDISTLVGVTRTTPSGNVINQLCFVERVEHDIAPASWVTRFGLSAQAQTSANFWNLDSDKLDASTILGY